MGQDDILKLIDSKPNKLWDSNDIKVNLKINPSSISQALKSLRTTGWLGYINYKNSRYYYYSLNNTKLRNLPLVLIVFAGVEGLHKKNIQDWLYKRHGVDVR